MKKNFKLIVSILVAVFALSIVGNTAFAAGNYDNIADGEHSISITSLEKGGTDVSGADNFIHNPSLTIKDGNATLTLEVGAGGGDFADFDFSIDWVTVDGKEPISEREDGDSTYFTFQLNEVKTNIPAAMKYIVPGIFPAPDGHKVEFDLELTGLDDLPEIDNNDEGNDNGTTNGEENDDEGNDNGTANGEENDDEGNEEAVEEGNGTLENGENNDGNGAVENGDEEEEVANPQTGDTSNIWLYAFLLVAAAIPLVIKFKKRSVQ